jgi:hypothetical protein
MFETPSATVTFAGPAYEPVNNTIFALRAVPAVADPTQTAATARTAATLVKRCLLKMIPFRRSGLRETADSGARNCREIGWSFTEIGPLA